MLEAAAVSCGFRSRRMAEMRCGKLFFPYGTLGAATLPVLSWGSWIISRGGVMNAILKRKANIDMERSLYVYINVLFRRKSLCYYW